jgi:hypothetical protein
MKFEKISSEKFKAFEKSQVQGINTIVGGTLTGTRNGSIGDTDSTNGGTPTNDGSMRRNDGFKDEYYGAEYTTATAANASV